MLLGRQTIGMGMSLNMLSIREVLDDTGAVATAKYIAGALAVICTLATVLLDKRQTELFERRQRPRTITAQQQRIFIETLAGSPRGKLSLQYLGITTEAYAFAQQLQSLLNMAGYEVPERPGGEGALSFGPPPTGIQILCKDPDHPPPLVEPLRIAFRTIGLEAVRQPSHGKRDDEVTVFVGLKE